LIVEIPLRGSVLRLNIPERNFLGVLDPKRYPPVKDVVSAFEDALRNPIGSKALRDLAKPGQRVVIIATDITRYACEEVVIPLLLKELNEAGIPDENISVVVATGTHRPNSIEEFKEMYSEEVVRRVKVENHNAFNPEGLKFLGNTLSQGIPVEINKSVAEADLRIATGVIEPHLFAGYSGGVKSVAVGVASVRTISATHNIAMLDHPKTRLGVIEDNLFRRFLEEAAGFLGLDFIVNVVLDDDKRLLGVFAGDPVKAHDAGVRFAKEIYEVKASQQGDIIIAIPRYPKDRDLYQATRAVNNLIFAPRPLVRKGGIIIIPAACEDGIGHEGYYNWMKSVRSPVEALERAYREGFEPGEHKAFVLAKALNWAKIFMVGTAVPEPILRELFLEYEPTVEEALERAFFELGKDAKVWVVPNALITIPVLEP